MSKEKLDTDSESKIPLRRRTFLGALASSFAIPSILASGKASGSTRNDEDTFNSDNLPVTHLDDEYEAVVVGSGFGGAVSACRLSAKWPGKVLTVERGKRYGRGEFPRGAELAKGFWRLEGDNVPRLYPLSGESRGLLDLRSYDRMDTLVAAGYGGGSLIYGNAIIEPISPFYDENWPAAVKKDQLRPYFDVFKEVLNVAKIPRTGEPERELKRWDVFEKISQEENKPRYDVDMGVFFGNDQANPTPMGQVEQNRYGVDQTSCTYCAECIVGCNFHAKNSVDLNYLHVAETKYDMQVRTEHLVDKIVPLNEIGAEDINADGTHGYHIYMIDLANKEVVSVKTNRVVLAAGTYGSTEILLKNKARYRTLRHVSGQIGKNYSGNADFLTIILETESPTDIGRGPTVIQYIDHSMGENASRDGFVAQDMSIPLSLVEGFVEMLKPSPMVKRHVKQALKSLKEGERLLLQVHVGLDKGNGRMKLNFWRNALRLSWPFWDSVGVYNNIINATHRAKEYLGGAFSLAFPTWLWPIRRNVTVHPLGGCSLGETVDTGVVSAQRGELGQVFNYKNLFVADGAIIPGPLGANPSVTIGALAEMISEEVTGNAPTSDL